MWYYIGEMNKKELINVAVEGIDMADFPDFCDAFIGYAEHADGTPLTEAELEELSDDSAFVSDLAYEEMF